MKLTKSQDQGMTSTTIMSGIDDGAGKSSGGVGAIIAVVCSLLGIGLLGTTAWLIYQNLALIENV